MQPARLDPILKYPGGKAAELDIIFEHMPAPINRYFEPFLGGGAVFLALPPTIPAYLNDISTDLIQLYRHIAAQDQDFFAMLEAMNQGWQRLTTLTHDHAELFLRLYTQYSQQTMTQSTLYQAVEQFVEANVSRLNGLLAETFIYDSDHFLQEVQRSLKNKIVRMRKIEEKRHTLPANDILDNIEGALKAALYTHFRYLYNYPDANTVQPGHYSAIFYFIRENAYAAMFRFNKDGKFNVPYGGISYNRKDLSQKIKKMQAPELIEKFRRATFENLDFDDFLEQYQPQSGDFLFLDPPYDTEFSAYDRNSFDQGDQARLAAYLYDCPANFMLVIKATDYIQSLYQARGLNIRRFEKMYMHTIKERNERKTTHLMITNY